MIDRASGEDMVSLATDLGPSPMQVGAVLRVGEALEPSRVAEAIDERIRTVPRLRQRLVRTPPGCGRPIWVDDADFDLDAHVGAVACPAPGDEDALLAVAAEVIATPLPADAPLWRLTQVTGLQGGGTALVVAFHHVLADGIGGLAVLANLVDGADVPPADAPNRPAPSQGELALDNLRERLRSPSRLWAWLGQARQAVAQLRATPRVRRQESSLNRPTGARRALAVVRADLDEVRRTAHAHSATVNDVVLAAATGALHRLLAARGESVDRFVVSVPVAARQRTTAGQLGNQVGVMPVEIPATGDPVVRIRQIAEVTRAAKQAPGTPLTPVLGPVFRLLARLGVFEWYINRQRLVHTFVTNLRGPDSSLRFLGAPVEDVVAVGMITGNISVAFAVLSYVGALDITVIVDPDAVPDLTNLQEALQDELDGLLHVEDGSEST